MSAVHFWLAHAYNEAARCDENGPVARVEGLGLTTGPSQPVPTGPVVYEI